jgi:hypothetical protein
MMVKMQENLAKRNISAVVEIWHDTFWKLALLFLPLAALVMVESRDIILALFTPKYAASIPLFRVWSGLILLATLQVDGVLRVYAETRYILMLNLMRLAVIAILIAPSMKYFHLLGPVGVILLATIAFKAGALIRIVRLLGISWAQLLPWRRVGLLGSAAAGAAGIIVLYKTVVTLRPLTLLLTSSALFCLVYCALVWRLGLLSASEKSAITGWLRRKVLRRSVVLLSGEMEGVQKLCAESPASSV